MKRFFKLKTFSIFLIITLSVLGVLSFLNKEYDSKYVITQNDQAVIITLENGNYFALRPEADYIIEDGKELNRPFGGLNSRKFSAYGVNYFFLRRNFTQEITSFDNERLIVINQIDKENLNLQYSILTSQVADSRADYVIQLDYSSNAKFSIGSDHITISDIGCEINIKNKGGGEIKKLDNYPSIIITQQYSSNLAFEIQLSTECIE